MPKKRTRKTAIADPSPSSPRPGSVEEADHRIKSSLDQVVSGLRLLATDGTLTRPDEALVDTAERIKAVAHLHALLSHSRNGGHETVVLDEYLNAVVDRIVDGVGAQPQVVLLVNADPIRVTVRVAGMLGQIVNEIVAAAGHSVDPNLGGTIQVECGTDADGVTVLQIGDDGKGYIDCSIRVRLGPPVLRKPPRAASRLVSDS